MFDKQYKPDETNWSPAILASADAPGSKIEQSIASRQMIESSQFDIFLVNPLNYNIECVSQGLIRSTGYTRNELLSMSLMELSIEHDHEAIKNLTQSLTDTFQKSIVLHTSRRNKNGEQIPVSCSIQQVIDVGTSQLIVMVHEKPESAAFLADNSLVDSLLMASTDATFITDSEFNIQRFNLSLHHVLEVSESNLRGQNICSLGFVAKDQTFNEMTNVLTKNGQWEGVFWKGHAGGQLSPILLKACKYQNSLSEDYGYVFVLNDMLKAEMDSYLLPNQNTQTGLPNRIQFIERVKTRLNESSLAKLGAAIFHLDINNFKKVNELYGHAIGDEILFSIAKRIAGKTHHRDIFANLGADEFVLFTEATACLNKDPTRWVQEIANRLINDFELPFMYKDCKIRITISIGVVPVKNQEVSAEKLLQQAEHAVNHAKINGISNFHIYDKKHKSELATKFAIENELHLAIENNEFEIYFQPQLELNSGKIKSAEALIRWNHPEKGLIRPDRFIPVLEESELIIPVGKWVIHEACRYAKQLQESGYEPIQISVNVSTVQLKNKGLITVLKNALMESKLDPCWLELEITESSVIKDISRSISLLNRINELGVSIALDDFGTGYSSLSYLKKLPIKTLKIDRSFVSGIPADKDDLTIIKTIIAMSKALNLQIVAEGVESGTQLDILRKLGCEKIQGYLIGRPTSATKFLQRLKNRPRCFDSFLHYG